MNITLQRHTGFGEPRTFGELLDEQGEHLVHTLEDKVREIADEPVANWKIKGETAIPAGRYRVTLEDSSHFGPDTLTINDVEAYEAIRMHGGNTERDTAGCPLLGMNRSAMGISNCAPAVEKVKALVREQIDSGNEVWINVVNAP